MAPIVSKNQLRFEVTPIGRVESPLIRVRVRNLEVVDGTPIVDVKPVLSSDISEVRSQRLLCTKPLAPARRPPRTKSSSSLGAR